MVDQLNNATGQSFSTDALARYIFGAFGLEPPANVNFEEPVVDILFDLLKDTLVLRRNFTVVSNLVLFSLLTKKSNLFFFFFSLD